MKPPFHIDKQIDPAFIDQVLAIDRNWYPEETDETWVHIAEQHPKMFTLVRRNDTVHGYVSLLGLRKAAFEALATGNMWEDELALKDIITNPHGFYLSSIAAKRQHAPFNQLLCGIAAGWTLHTGKPTIAVPVTRAGEKLAMSMQMTPTASHPLASKQTAYDSKVYLI